MGNGAVIESQILDARLYECTALALFFDLG